MPLFRCQQFTRAPWFRDLALELEPGELRVIMGPTGSGKSLFLRGLADLDPVDFGQVWLKGKERMQETPGQWRRSVLYLHQNAPRVPGSVRDNLLATAAPASEPGTINPFDLKLEQSASELSGGEGQLLAITRALVSDPSVYLLDESTSALDAKSAERVEQELRARLDQGAAMLWVTHDERIAERMGASVLRFGKLSP